ncbi:MULTISPECIES: hypothetical protein [Rhizobium]|nr:MULTISPECIES: hypothetical protein [Rhizobium]
MKVMVQPAFVIEVRLKDLDPFAAKMKRAAADLKAAERDARPLSP